MSTVTKAHTDISTGKRVVDRAQSTLAPSATDDASDDFAIGSVWDLVDSNGVVTNTYVCTASTQGAATWTELAQTNALQSIRAIEEVIVLNGAASNNLVNQLPAGAVPLIALVNYDSAVALATAVKLGLGTAASIVGIGKTGTTVTKNAKNTLCNGALVGVPVAAATTLQLASVDTSGAAAGTATSGSVRVRVIYALYNPLPDA